MCVSGDSVAVVLWCCVCLSLCLSLRLPVKVRCDGEGDATMRWMGVVAAVAVVVVVVVLSAGEALDTQPKCQGKTLCHECIQTIGCAWCINPQVGEKNCQPFTNFNNTTICNKSDIQNPKSEIYVMEDEELTGSQRGQKGKGGDDILQLKPQRIKLRLRKDDPQKINITYRRAGNYPVDLYYLMDLSNSMKDDKENLADVGTHLAQTMTSLTSQFTLGFGSFVDKVMMPFTNTTKLHENKPCEGCAFPYSFRNDMRLSQDHTQFTTRVREAKISGNLDHPEGGFDALMQAMVCKNEIGWRDVARRILVFSTDAKFHHAGDGRLAGVVMPNDEQCHLNAENEYTDYDKYDYPSIGQINKVAEEKNINIIFAVLSYYDLYSDLSKNIKTSSFGKLKNGSTNVVDLIIEQYNSISSSVTLTDNSTNNITIKYSSSCKNTTVRDTNKCDDIKEDDQVTFQLEITANRCPENGESSIVEVKTLEDTVTLEIEFLCSCNCPPSPPRSKCNNGGALVCGVCECAVGFYGEECQCGSDDDSSEDQDQNAKCKFNDKDTQPCSGRGSCKCGVCNCQKPEEVTGTYCECNRRKCMNPKGLECSGHGRCDCNVCKCNQGYSGVHCSCEDRACKPQVSDKVCSGHGKCECGKCICGQQENATYTGRYCEDCLSCETGKCSKFKDCVQCVNFGIGPRKHDCNTCAHSQQVDSLDEHMHGDSRLCTFEDADGCYLNFTYRYLEDEKKDEVFVQAKRQCPEAAPIMSIVFSLIGVIVAIGVITLLLWKVFTSIHDQREYAKFKKETEDAQFPAEENPLYVSATTTTQNPMFETQQVH